jgi:hypothetical protein
LFFFRSASKKEQQKEDKVPPSVFGFSALRAEKPNTNKNKMPLCRRQKRRLRKSFY